jgi:plasmid stabilization system protein ParE
LESTKESSYKVVITDPAEISFYEVLEYLYDNYPLDKAEQIADELRDTATKLHYQPERGTLETRLSHRSKDYRYVIYKHTSRADIKVIYYIDNASYTVYIGFPSHYKIAFHGWFFIFWLDPKNETKKIKAVNN